MKSKEITFVFQSVAQSQRFHFRVTKDDERVVKQKTKIKTNKKLGQVYDYLSHVRADRDRIRIVKSFDIYSKVEEK